MTSDAFTISSQCETLLLALSKKGKFYIIILVYVTPQICIFWDPEKNRPVV